MYALSLLKLVTRKRIPIESMRAGLMPRDTQTLSFLPLNGQPPGTNFRPSGDSTQGAFRVLIALGLIPCRHTVRGYIQ